jgi:non-ribosomal peptide synthetase component E (peptide arylation enzyme)
MLPKFKITTCAFILCLFGLTLITVLPVSALQSMTPFDECRQIKPNGKSYALMKEKKNCFRDLAKALNKQLQASTPSLKCAEEQGEVERCVAQRHNAAREKIESNFLTYNATYQGSAKSVYGLVLTKMEQGTSACFMGFKGRSLGLDPPNL